MSPPDDGVEQQLAAWARATAELTAPGAAYEINEEEVGGERMQVFAQRHASLRDVLAASTRFGDRDVVILSDGERFTFDEFEREVASVAAGLADRGVGPGDRVAICAANCAGWLLSFWAITALDAVVVAMNGWWTAVEMEHALRLTEPTLVLGDTKRLQRLGDVDIPVVVFDADFEPIRSFDREAPLPDVPIAEDDDAMLVFTSGTTGRPKAAVLTHRNIIAYVMLQGFIADRSMAAVGIRLDGPLATRLAVFPLFHVSGLGSTVGSLHGGGTMVWTLGRFDPATVIALTKEHGIRGWTGTVAHIMRLLDHPDLDSLDPEAIMQVGIGGSATSPLLVRRTEERFPHLKGTFSSGYGSTESGGLISFASNRMLVNASDCVGPILPTVDVRIVDEHGEDLPPGTEGNIAARSALVMRGYWNHPTGNADVFLPGGWVRTGDFGRLEDGMLFIASRTRDLILRGGENVYPFEIENRLEEHPEITESAVIGVDDATLGQEIKAIVVVGPRSALTVDAVRAWCAETLASYKVPAMVELRTEPMPRNPTGKIMKHLLAQPAESMFVDD